MRAGRRSRRRERNKSKKTHDEINLQRLITNTKHDRDGAKWKHQTNQYNRNVGHLSSVVRSYVSSAGAAAGFETWAYSDHVGCRHFNDLCRDSLIGSCCSSWRKPLEKCLWLCFFLMWRFWLNGDACLSEEHHSEYPLPQHLVTWWQCYGDVIACAQYDQRGDHNGLSMRGSSVLLVDFVVVLRSCLSRDPMGHSWL